jgi:hypothetical protein
MTDERSQLARLAQRFPTDFVQQDPGGNDYVSHENVTQFLLGIVGPFSFELREIIRGDVPGRPPDPKGRSTRAKEGTPDLHQVIVGGVWTLTLTIDGRTVRLEEAGDVEDPHNWRHDGQRLKQAASDAIKRCAMRAGLGLELWAQDKYILDQRLRDQAPPSVVPALHPSDAAGGPQASGVTTDPEVTAPYHTPGDDATVAVVTPARVAGLVGHVRQLAAAGTPSAQAATTEVLRRMFAEEGAPDPFAGSLGPLPEPLYRRLVGRLEALARSVRLQLVDSPPATEPQAEAEPEAEGEGLVDLSVDDPTCDQTDPAAADPDDGDRCTLAATHVVAGLDHETWDGRNWPAVDPAPQEGQPAWATRPHTPDQPTTDLL